MGDKALSGLIAIMTAVIGVAIVAVLVSKNAQTAGVLQAGFSGFSSVLSAATGPVLGSSGPGLNAIPLSTGG
jgi:PRD1 phage membrane DNA delivery